ncbi:MAG: malto-oligosyltrehalose synthase [Syntrophothermus sp.]
MRIPLSTYRLQFTPGFGFNSAKKIVSYLADLGISDIYASPIFKAVEGSMHGYDQVDPLQLNPQLGSSEEFEELVKEYKKYELHWLQDIVPNHMAYSSQNQMIVDLLENGPNSRFYDFFDIEWNHPHASVRQRLLAPFLGRFYHEALENEELVLKYDAEGFSINYFDNRFPLSMESYVDILSFRLSAIRNKLGKNDSEMIKYLAVLYILRSLPTSEEIDERYSQIKFVKGMLWELYNQNEEIRNFMNESLKIFNGRKDSPESFDLLDKLLTMQYFRLAFWKVANEEINYRRFFNISSLISLKMENEDVFNRVHDYVLRLIKAGSIDGLRIDHVDGLYDPTNYLKRLRSRTENNYIAVEKILEIQEDLPDIWPVQGTTGYDFTNFVNDIFVKRENERKMTSVYQEFTHLLAPPDRVMWEKKKLIIQTRMAGEVERLAFLVEAVSSRDRRGIDITMHGLKRALEEILTFFPVYRTYVNGEFYLERDKKYMEEAFKKISEENPRLSNEFSYICNLLMLNNIDQFPEEKRKNIIDLIMKFQQLTGPLMAKGFEDTALYVYNRLISLNEVGGSPSRFGLSDEEFHGLMTKRLKNWPATMNATSTHDTKRGEDTRTRINVLSELAGEWDERIKHWCEINSRHKSQVKGQAAPEKNDEYFLYQTLIGSWPLDGLKGREDYLQRIKDYLIKAVREAKVHTAWIKPDESYENAYVKFVGDILDGNPPENKFLEDFISFQSKIAWYGYFNSISQLLVKMTGPGVPDFYQGCELWDLSLVDPDNRRPVDYTLRKQYLRELREYEDGNLQKYITKLSEDFSNAKIKIFLTARTLKIRKKYEQLFQQGEYIPIKTEGSYKDSIIAFVRRYNENFSITVVPRFLTGIISPGQLPYGEVWKDTKISLPFEVSQLNNVITDEQIQSAGTILVGTILSNFPAAVIIGSIKS